MPTSSPPAALHAQPWTLGRGEFVALMAFIQALQAVAIDAMLPALGAISADLGVADANRRQLIVGVFLLFSGIGSLVPGALADRFGRRPVLLTCIAGYVVMMVVSALSADFRLLIVSRAATGLFSSGMSVLPLAIIRDKFEGDRMARTQSLISVIFMVVPMIAPSLGLLVLQFAGWRWIFGIMATMGVLVAGWVFVRLPETLHPDYRQQIEPSVIAHNLWLTLTNRAAVGYVFGAALVTGGLFGFVNSAEQLISEHFGAGSRFPLVFGGMALCMACANFTNSRIVERFGSRRVSQTALFVFIASSSLQVFLALHGEETIFQFIPVMALSMCMMGFIGANFSAIALQPFARIAGSAASIQVFIRMIIAALMGILIGQSYDGTAFPLALGLLLAGCCSVGLVLFSERGRLFQRLHQPGQPWPPAES
jgi:MFS transporter, DHA1 family, multidrug resistance protein